MKCPSEFKGGDVRIVLRKAGVLYTEVWCANELQLFHRPTAFESVQYEGHQ